MCVFALYRRNIFSDALNKMNNNPQFKHSLRRLTPFTDKNQLVRVGGRLKNSPLSFTAKHPLLLPKNSHLSVLICNHYHLYTLHGGPLMVQSIIQRRYWIFVSTQPRKAMYLQVFTLL
jgi:hypothetical protein